MNSDRHSTPFPLRAACALLAVLGVLLFLQTPVYAKSSASPVPQPRWNSSSMLQPDAIIGDSTYFGGTQEPKNGDTLIWHAVDIEGSYLFTATGQGFQAIDISGATPNPIAYLWGYYQGGGSFPFWQHSDKDWYIKELDAPEGDPTTVALGMEEQGFAIVRNANTAGATIAYQREVDTSQVYAFSAGGGKYAYGMLRDLSGINLYNLNAAANLTKCHELPPATSCNVFMGAGGFGTGWSQMSGTGTFLATGKTSKSASVTIWNVSTPGLPAPVVSIPGGTLGLALWKVGSSYFLARIDLFGTGLAIYNVSCIASGSCPATPSPVWSGTIAALTMKHVTASVDGANAYLYIGADDLGTCVPQREYVYDVTSPSGPVELTPKIHPDGYWGWYYMGCSTGFSLVGPRTGKVKGNKLYRAAYTLLDSHKINKGGPPTANFSWTETEIYPGTPVHFTDQSSGGPATWMWEFSGGTPANSSDSNPTVTFDSAGTKPVTLRVLNAQTEQSAPVTQNVTVLDPAPVLGSITVSPAAPTVCQPVTLTAVNGKGAPTLNYDFAVLDDGSEPVAGNSGAAKTFVWNTGASTEAGVYTARVTLSNGAGSVTKSTNFTLTGLTTIVPNFPITNDVFLSGTVKFHAAVAGATAWNWDFDGDNVFNEADWTTDPVNGPNPTHTYTTKGLRQVHVKVKNCVQSEVLSAALAIDITQITPLKALFAFNIASSGGVYFGDTTTAIPVLDASTGAELWDYDWNGDGTFEDAGNTAPRTSHLYSATGTFHPQLRVRRGASEQDVYPAASAQITIIISQGGGGGGGGGGNNPSITISGPASGNVSTALSYTASAANCTADRSGWTWNAPGGTITGAPAADVTISWTSAGNKTVTATNPGCSGVTGSKSVTINSGGGGGGGGTVLKADWSFSPAAPIANQAVAFNGSASTGSPTGYTWDFGDGTGFGTGAQINHTYTAAGSYRVQLTVTKAGSSCPPAPFCESSLVKTVVVGTGEAPLLPAFTTSASCINEGGLNVCTAKPNQALTFTDASQGTPTSWSWNFGDGGTATGQNATHSFKAGSYNVVLTIGRNGSTASTTRTFNIVGDPEPAKSNTIVLPWIAQSRGTLEQSSDLYVHNPGTIPMEIVLEFRKRGLPEVNPPKATRTIQPGATLYVADVLKELFNWENIVGFVTVTRTKGDADPVMTSFNTTYKDGSQFGQTIPGFVFNQEAATATTGTRMQYLVGLNDNGEREAYFGLTNPNNGPATYRLKFFDALGRPIGTPSADFKLSSYGLKQFQPAEIRSLFGINAQDDYRVEVETVSGGQIFPYGANVRTASDDPSFLGVGSSSTSKLYLIGALSTPGLNNSLWQTDIVLANTGTQVALTDVTFTKAGLNDPTTALKVTLQPGETQRLENLVASQWNIKDSVGVVTLSSDSPNEVFPIVQGESYNNANPSMRFGQFMAAFTDSDAAETGEAAYLVGLRQDADNRTTYWIFNPPGGPQAQYDIIYRGLDGAELGRVSGVLLGSGKLRQFSPSQHALPATGAPGGGFTVQIKVKAGKVLTAAQVVNNKTNDPAYVQGQAQ
ncbi:MAG: PKD domain-containing protein [Acidobacteriota bacterium]